LFCLGYPDQALRWSYAAIAEARKLAHLPSLADSLFISVLITSLNGEITGLGERTADLIAVAAEHGFAHFGALGSIYHGWVKVKSGDVTEGLSLLRNGSAAFRNTGSEVWTPHFFALMAGACEIAGQIEKALTLLDEALQIVERTVGYWFAAELNRQKGQLLLRQGNSEAAEELYRKALSVAREQEAKLWELRATISLARLRRDQGRSAEAHARLAPVYGWFTEGFDIPDLKEAKALIDELSA